MTPSERITSTVTGWDGIEAGPGKRGEFGFRLGRREIGHLHGDHAAHFFFGRERWRSSPPRGGSSSTPSSPAATAPPRDGSRATPTSTT